METDSSNIIQVVYSLEQHLYGNLVSQLRQGISFFHSFDGNGSTIQLTNLSGSILDSYLYDSFGIEILAGSNLNPYRFIGDLGYYFNVDLSQYLLRRRNYNSQSGRFTSIDPLSKFSYDYIYSSNNPLKFFDPSGLDKELGIVLEGQPTRGDCGEAKLKTKWILGTNIISEKKNGWVIQRVHFNCGPIDCNWGGVWGPCKLWYYEAWEVMDGHFTKGDTDTFHITQKSSFNFKTIDGGFVNVNGTRNQSCKTCYMEGLAFFVSVEDLKNIHKKIDLENDWRERNSDNFLGWISNANCESLDMRITPGDLKFHRQGLSGFNKMLNKKWSVEHTLNVNWWCCCNLKNQTNIAYSIEGASTIDPGSPCKAAES